MAFALAERSKAVLTAGRLAGRGRPDLDDENELEDCITVESRLREKERLATVTISSWVAPCRASLDFENDDV